MGSIVLARSVGRGGKGVRDEESEILDRGIHTGGRWRKGSGRAGGAKREIKGERKRGRLGEREGGGEGREIERE
jgi:hypothetical protein